MTPSYTLAEMLRQADALADDLRTLHAQALDQVRGLLPVGQGLPVISRVYLVGSGDSYHAALAAQMAFHRLAGVSCEPLSALRMLEYGAAWEQDDALLSGALVIGISASGGNRRLIQALERAAEHGARTLAITATEHSPLTQATEHALTLPLEGLRPCPGIRTYQASLLGLLLTAIELGRQRGHRSTADVLNREVLAAADAVEATTVAVRSRCEQLADRIAGAPVTMVLGSGPGYGTALFAAAKLIEAAGVFAAGQDLEEWEHVEVLARPRDMPTMVIATPGRSRSHALRVATRARGYGRTVIAVANDGDHDLAETAHVVLPVHGTVREEFSGLVSHLFAGPLACFMAKHLNRLPFATNRP